jgi:hypothetical protein
LAAMLQPEVHDFATTPGSRYFVWYSAGSASSKNITLLIMRQ